MTNKKAEDFKEGDLVVCANPGSFLSARAAYLANRIGVVKKSVPIIPGDRETMWQGRVLVLWGKRNGRGKESQDWMFPNDLELA